MAERSSEDAPEPIRFKDALGRKFTFPFDVVKTWDGMEELIQQAFLQADALGSHVQEGHYDLIGPDGEIVLPSVWGRLVQPGWAVTMTMTEEVKKKIEEEIKAKATKAAEQAPIRFKDAVGRKFSFPFHLCATWRGMEELIKQAFIRIDVLGPHVQEGRYDLIGPDGEIILPSVWEKVVQPDWAISMAMWPMDKPPPIGPRTPRHGGPVPTGQPPIIPGGMPPTGGARRPGQGMPPGGIPPPPAWRGRPRPPGAGASNVINVAPKKSSSKKKSVAEASSWAAFFAGKPPKKKSHRTVPSPPGSPRSDASLEVRSEAPSTVSRAPRPQPKFGGGPFQSSRKSQVKEEKERRQAEEEQDRRSLSEGSESTSASSYLQHEKLRRTARERGPIILLRGETKNYKMTRHRTFQTLEKNPEPTDRQVFSAARLSQDEVSKGMVCLELTKLGSHLTNNFTSSDAEKMTWITVTRSVLDLNEFENIALDPENLAVNQNIRQAMEALFKTLEEKKLDKSRNTWQIKTGTVIRCDVRSDGKTKASVVFASIPQLQVDSFHRTTSVQPRKGICLPHRLHERFNPYDTSLTRDKNQLFRSHEGAQLDEVLWIGDIWVLIIDSVGILTYGNKHRQTYLSDNIEIRDHQPSQVEGRTIHVTHPDGRQFQIPFEECKTLYKLQTAIQDQLSILEGDDSIPDFELVIADGNTVTAKIWSRLVQRPEQSVIKLVVEWVVPDGSESDGSSIKSAGQVDEISDWSADFETDKQDVASERSIPNRKRSRSVSQQRTTVSFVDNDFFGIQQQSSTTKDEDSSLDIPELNPKVPPFLGWSILEASNEDEDDDKLNEKGSTVRESITVCLFRAETALKDSQHPLVAKLKDTFDTLDLPSTSDDVEFNDIEKKILHLGKKDSTNGNGRGLRFGENKIASLYKDFFSASIRTLEAYTFKEFPSPVISTYYTALSKGLESPRLPPNNHYPVRWVLSREPVPMAGFKYINTTLDGVKCSDCNSQKIYGNIESAIEHLRKRHCAGSTPKTRVMEYLTQLSEAKESRLMEECSEVLRICRDTMVRIITQLRDIQDAMVFDNQFQKPAQGIPFALLKSLELIVAFVCTAPIILDELYWFYNYEVDEQQLSNLVPDEKIQAKYQLLKDVGHEAETLIKDAERALVSSIHSKRKGDVVKFFTPVGPHCVAIQIICNLLRHPVYNNTSAAELYQTYCTDYGSEVFRHPSKRQIPAIGAMADELARLKTVIEWQQELVSCLRTVLSPEIHLPSSRGTREKVFEIEDWILIETEEELDEQFNIISSSLDQCQELIRNINTLMEIMSDDQNRAILVFTVVTVIFLPMSFIAAYLSMNGGPSEDHWGKTQVLFWEISAPLALGIGAFCLGTAWYGSEVGPVKEWASGVANRLRNKPGRSDSEMSDSSSTCSEILDEP